MNRLSIGMASGIGGWRWHRQWSCKAGTGCQWNMNMLIIGAQWNMNMLSIGSIGGRSASVGVGIGIGPAGGAFGFGGIGIGGRGGRGVGIGIGIGWRAKRSAGGRFGRRGGRRVGWAGGAAVRSLGGRGVGIGIGGRSASTSAGVWLGRRGQVGRQLHWHWLLRWTTCHCSNKKVKATMIRLYKAL
jgi:hypothetical protein